MTPKVSVIIPAHNAAKFLADAVQSVRQQSFGDFEVVIVDDGSTDNTDAVVISFDDGRIGYVRQENKGLPGARNTGIRASGGEYIAFLDADDWFLPHKLEVQTRFLDESPDVGLVASGWVETDAQGNPLRIVEPWHWCPDLSLARIVMGAPLVVHGVLARRTCLDAVGLFDEGLRWREDWDLWLRLAAAGCRFAWLPEIVCRYRLHGSNMARNWRRMCEGGQSALDKLFAAPDLPEEVRRQRDSAYGSLHIDAAVRAYSAGDFGGGNEELSKAVELDTNLLEGSPRRLIRALVAWSDNPIVGGSERYLRALCQHLPAVVPDSRFQVRKAVSARYMDKAFAAYQHGQRATALAWLSRALGLDPAWVRNRGVLVIAVRLISMRRLPSSDALKTK